MPAQLTQSWMPPNAATVTAMPAAEDSSSATSTLAKIALPACLAARA